MRVFIGINFDEKLKSYLQEKQNEIRFYCAKGNFSHKENFHLTLRFIGEVSKEQITNIKQAMDVIGESCEKFELDINHLGSFERQSEHIIWIGLGGELSKLNNVYNTIQLELSKIGILREKKPLTPHITLGRRVQVKDDFNTIKRKVAIEKKLIQADSIVLMESKRINGRLTYIPVYEKRLCCRD